MSGRRPIDHARCRNLTGLLVSWSFGVVLALPGLSRAQNSPAPPEISSSALKQVELDFQAGAGCPEQPNFVAEVAARVQHPVEWVNGGESQRMRVRLRSQDGHAFGSLTTEGAGAEPSQRDFEAATCAEVGSALALVAALALDSNASADKVVPSSPALAEMGSALPRQDNAEEPVPEADPDWLWFVAPALDLSLGNAPEPLASLGMRLGVRSTRHGDWSPFMQLTPLWGETGTTGPAVKSAVFTFLRARLEGCPLRWSVDPRFGLAGCATLELGRVAAHSAGEDLAARPVHRFWSAAGLSGGAHIVGERGFAELFGHALAALTRDDFVRATSGSRSESIYRPARISLGVTFALGVEF